MKWAGKLFFVVVLLSISLLSDIFAQTGSVLTFSEIMFDPSETNGEFVEIYNTSTTETVDLTNYKFKYYTSSNNNIVALSGGMQLGPGKFAVILQGNYDYTNGIYKTLIPADAIVLKISSNSFGSSGMANTTSRDVYLINASGQTIDTYTYSANNSAGISDEKYILSKDNTAANWKNSLTINGTPGKNNSVSPLNYDLNITFAGFIPSAPKAEDTLKITVKIKNAGRLAVANFSVDIFNDANDDSLGQSGESIFNNNYTNLASGDSIMIQQSIYAPSAADYHFIAAANFTGDENTSNNKAFLKITVAEIPASRNEIVVNEFMYAPSNDEPEWIELYNTSYRAINLKNWKITDNSTTVTISTTDYFLNPGEYLVVASDAAISNYYRITSKFLIKQLPSLNNSGDDIILRSNLNTTIDSLKYSSSWGGTGGKSLERIESTSSSTNSLNWRTSTNAIGATPGFINSVSKKNYDVKLLLPSIYPKNPIIGETVKINIGMWNDGKKPAEFKVTLHEIMKDGRKIFLKEQIVSLPALVEIIFYITQLELTVDNLSGARTFEYFADFPQDQDTTNNRKIIKVQPGYPSGSVVINEIMYTPVNGEPEWIELYNNSQYDIDLEDWSIIDVLITPVKNKIQAKDYIFPSKTFLVVAKDSTIKNFHGTIPSKLIVSTFANLNNDADGVVFKDSRDVTIDSVRYESFWGGANGKSLERKSISASSVDRNNWSSSKDIELSTPGRENSITQKRYDLAINAITTTPQYPLLNEEVGVSAKVINYGLEKATDFTVKFYLKVNNSATFFAEGKGINLNGSDSVWITANTKLKLNNNKTILCKVIFSGDEDTLNNSFIAEVSPGAKRNSVQISEVMYDPLSGESEWVEIFNSSNDQVNLKNWQISDLLPSPTKSVITVKDNFLSPGEYAIITYDSLKYPYYPPRKFFQAKFGSLSSTDGVMIYDFRNSVIDSLKYNSSWGGAKGYSMERFSFSAVTNDSLNWATTLDPNGGTAGFKNSVVNTTRYSFGSLVINEIMFDPATGNAEYLEFYNTTNDSIQLGGMEIRIGSSAKFKLANTFYKLPPQNYFVLASDSSIYRSFPWLKLENKTKIAGSSSLSLSNDGAQLILKDLRGDTLDSLNYSFSWHNKNILTTKSRSLERLNPLLGSNVRSNWNTSVNAEGGSPGKQNSIYSENTSRELKVTISPNPFSPDNDGYEDYAIINFDLTQPFSQVRIKVFDSQGRLVRSIAENKLAASKNSVIFDGLDDSGRPLRIGIYILLIEAVAEGSGNVEVMKTPVVVARKL
ncbi:MAG: lamin tail domain-containing protein [Ignavibacteriales bacterium]|nr:lamin tail domain-containing protein [Ignavibacteriales bacterium]